MDNNNVTQQKKSEKKWPLWTGGALAVALVSGGIGAAIASEDNDDSASQTTESSVTSQIAPERSTATTNSEAGGDSDAAEDAKTSATAAALRGMSTADEAAAYIETATGTVSGTPAGIDMNQDGSWDVEIMESANSEVTVRVYEDGSAQIVDTDREDDSRSLTQENIARIFETALADTDGTIVSVSAEDEDGEDRDAYSVEILSNDGTQVVELELDATYSVIDRETEGVEDFLD